MFRSLTDSMLSVFKIEFLGNTEPICPRLSLMAHLAKIGNNRVNVNIASFRTGYTVLSYVSFCLCS